MKQKFIIFWLLFGLSFGIYAQEYRNSVRIDSSLTQQEYKYIKFLYDYMPLSDLADYDQNFFLAQVRTSINARKFFKWGNTIPEEIFLHFVLPIRVNNENLDTARQVFFGMLKERIKDMTMYDAIKEVNHFAHEHVNYRASDGRTSSPLATL
ncbi:MAG: hypothetical protein LBR28_06410, partial [Bacteroidales bacterium]|nr:hypothetical protein [Bacteroidales bacterium]